MPDALCFIPALLGLCRHLRPRGRDRAVLRVLRFELVELALVVLVQGGLARPGRLANVAKGPFGRKGPRPHPRRLEDLFLVGLAVGLLLRALTELVGVEVPGFLPVHGPFGRLRYPHLGIGSPIPANYSANQFNFEIGTILGQASLPKDTFKILNWQNRQIWSTRVDSSSWNNFAVKIDYSKK